jgi:Holliday junction resolvasome RuvABC endonuclease subunit
MITAFDLALGITGYVTLAGDDIIEWGLIRTPTSRRKGETGIQFLSRRLQTLTGDIETIVLDTNPDHVVIEVSDWHQNLNTDDWQKQYARERVVQRRLGNAEGAVLLKLAQMGIEPLHAPVSEVKQWWGSKSKQVIASMVIAQYPQLGGAGDDVTDAASIALYTQAMLRAGVVEERAVSWADD